MPGGGPPAAAAAAVPAAGAVAAPGPFFTVKPGGTSSAGAALPGKPGGTSPSMPAADVCGLVGSSQRWVWLAGVAAACALWAQLMHRARPAGLLTDTALQLQANNADNG